MKLRTAICMPLIVMLFVCACTGKPKIEFDEIIHNFGDVKQNVELIHFFTFKNTGDSNLVIEKVKAG